MYATLWALDIRFDTRLFAVASCMLGYIETSVLDFGTGIHNLAQYVSAEKRIRVCGEDWLECVYIARCRRFSSWMTHKGIVGCCLRLYRMAMRESSVTLRSVRRKSHRFGVT